MRLEVEAANILAEAMADLLAGGRVVVFDAVGNRLAECPFAVPPFAASANGAIAAHPFPAARGLADGAPASFKAFDVDGMAILEGSAGYKDAIPPPEMKFKTRVIVEDADVLVEAFIFSLVMEEPNEPDL